MNTDKQIVHNVKVFRQACLEDGGLAAMLPVFDAILYKKEDNEDSNNQRSTQQPAEEADSGSC